MAAIATVTAYQLNGGNYEKAQKYTDGNGDVDDDGNPCFCRGYDQDLFQWHPGRHLPGLLRTDRGRAAGADDHAPGRFFQRADQGSLEENQAPCQQDLDSCRPGMLSTKEEIQ